MTMRTLSLGAEKPWRRPSRRLAISTSRYVGERAPARQRLTPRRLAVHRLNRDQIAELHLPPGHLADVPELERHTRAPTEPSSASRRIAWVALSDGVVTLEGRWRALRSASCLPSPATPPGPRANCRAAARAAGPARRKTVTWSGLRSKYAARYASASCVTRSVSGRRRRHRAAIAGHKG